MHFMRGVGRDLIKVADLAIWHVCWDVCVPCLQHRTLHTNATTAQVLRVAVEDCGYISLLEPLARAPQYSYQGSSNMLVLLFVSLACSTARCGRMLQLLRCCK